MAIIETSAQWLRRRLTPSDDQVGNSWGYWPSRIHHAVLHHLDLQTGKLLDLGCGEGLLLRRILQDRPQIECWGIDREPYQLGIALTSWRSTSRLHIQLGSEGPLPYRNDMFDVITITNVFMNLEANDVGHLLIEAARVCKPGGIILFDVRNALSPYSVMYRYAPLFDHTIQIKTTHLHRQILTQVMASHCSIIRTIPIGFPFCALAPVLFYVAQKQG